MSALVYLYAAVVAVATALAWISIASADRPTLRLGATTLAVAMMAVGYVGLLELLGRPKPIGLEWGREAVRDAEVLAADLREGQGIYLWLRSDASAEPLSYRLPWSLDQARSLRDARRQAEADGTATRMRRPFAADPSDEEPLFYAAPQPALPPKSAEP